MRKRYNYDDASDAVESLHNLTMKGSTNKRKSLSIHTVPAYAAIIFLLILLGLYGIVYVVDNILPTPLELSDEVLFPDAFITQRAQHDLKLLTDLGPRIVGSYENEVLAVDYLKRELSFIVQQANASQRIEIDVQTVSGSYYWDTAPAGFILAYANVQNVVAKLYSHNESAYSILLNAHFDSVPTSPGGSDDGINCAVMLEVLRKLSRAANRPQHNIVFLFNGAEETGLLAAHGFITQHKWARESRVVINLEAAGAGGKIILFQSGPATPWLTNYYARVPHPYGQASGEEIFQSDLIPSDTDFRIFRDYGGLVGVDMAFFKSGYRYHTKFDDFEHIPLGSYQHAGDNTLSLTRQLANAPEVGDTSLQGSKVVFYDVLGLFMVSYSDTIGTVINYSTVLLSVIVSFQALHGFKLAGSVKQVAKTIGLVVLSIVSGWFGAIIAVSVVALLLDSINYSMSWYGNPWIIIGLYMTPSVMCPIAILLLMNRYTLPNLSPNIKALLQAHIVRLIWTLMLLIGTAFNIRSMYVLTLPILFNCVAFIIIFLFKLKHSGAKKWQLVYVITLIPPTMFLIYAASTTLSLFVPLTGRIGTNKNSELIIALLAAVATILITSSFIILVTLVRNARYVLLFLFVIFIGALIIVFTPLGFPYSGNTDSPSPERFWILHTRRIFHHENGTEINRDAGYFMLNMDRNSPNKVKKYVNAISNAKSIIDDDCKKYLLCGMPLAHAKMAQVVQYSSWIPAGQPYIQTPTRLELLSRTQLSSTVMRYNVSITGPDRVGVLLSPLIGAQLLNISLLDAVPTGTNVFEWNGRPLYFISRIYGKEAAALEFTFDVQVKAGEMLRDDAVYMEIAVTGFHVHDKLNQKMPEFVAFLGEFPDWADLTVWLGTFDSWFL